MKVKALADSLFKLLSFGTLKPDDDVFVMIKGKRHDIKDTTIYQSIQRGIALNAVKRKDN